MELDKKFSSVLAPTSLSRFNFGGLNSCCTEVSLVLVLAKNGDILDFGIIEHLDDPHHLVPIHKLDKVSQLLQRVYVSNATSGFDPFSGSKPVGASISKLLVTGCTRLTSGDFCLHCVMEKSYPYWKVMTPLLEDLSFGSLLVLLKHGDILVHYEDSLPYKRILLVPMEDDSSGVYRFTIGQKDFKKLGDVGIEPSIWKVFWLSVRRSYPSIEKPVWFVLTVNCSNSPIPYVVVSLGYKLDGLVKFRKVCFPQYYGNFWAAVAYLFSIIPDNACSGPLPIHHLDAMKD